LRKLIDTRFVDMFTRLKLTPVDLINAYVNKRFF